MSVLPLQAEALEVADRVVVMNGGRLAQRGSPDEVYGSPASPFVYDFLGSVSMFHGRVHRGRVRIGALELPAPEHAGKLVVVIIPSFGERYRSAPLFADLTTRTPGLP